MAEAESIKRPSDTLLAMEQRVLGELMLVLAAAPLLRMMGRGDMHPVLTIPGFGGSDRSMQVLRWVLRGQGYYVHGWGLGPNLGPTGEAVDGLRRRLADLHERHGRRVSIIGQSAGGIYARELARESPHAVRQVITLGSPFRYRRRDRTVVTPLAERMRLSWVPWFADGDLPEEDRPPVPVPVTV